MRGVISGEQGGIDIDDLRAHTNVFGGYTSEDDQILWIWELLKEDEDFKKNSFRLIRGLLRFITGLTHVPVGGFKNMKRRIEIYRIERENPDISLPSAHTCVYQLNIPQYSSKDIMKERLIYAIEASPQMGFI